MGENAYLALPKGQLTEGHVLIIPVIHRQNTLQLPEEAMAEIGQFKSALIRCWFAKGVMDRMFREQGKAVLLLERNLTTRNPLHCHIQVLPIDPAKGVSVWRE